MTILTHTVVAGLLGARIDHPLGAALAGFFSHFILDLIPHNDYLYLWRNEKARNPYTTVTSFLLLVLTLAFLVSEFLFIERNRITNILIASLLGIIPDAYTGFKTTFNLPDDPFDRFHNRIHHQVSFAEIFFNRNNHQQKTSRARSLAENYLLLKNSSRAKKGWLMEIAIELLILTFGLKALGFPPLPF